MCRTTRLQSALMATSTTDPVYVVSMSPDEILYAEAKLALGRGEIDAALALFQQVSEGYENTAAYVSKCKAYRQLCAAGVVQKPRDSLRVVLAEALPQAQGMSLGRYADALRKHGYDAATLKTLTLTHLEAVASAAEMKPGHKLSLEAWAEARSEWYEKVVYRVQRAVEQCGGWERVARKLSATPVAKVEVLDDDDDATGGNADDETAGDE